MNSTMCSYLYRAGITVDSMDDVKCSGTARQYGRTGPRSMRWSKVVTLRPPEMEYCYLAVRHCEPLLVGVSNENNNFSLWGWKVDRASMEYTGDSWPLLCHFASVQISVEASKKKKQEVSLSHTSMGISPPGISMQPISCKYYVAVAACFSRRFSRITEVVDNVLEFWKAIT